MALIINRTVTGGYEVFDTLNGNTREFDNVTSAEEYIRAENGQGPIELGAGAELISNESGFTYNDTGLLVADSDADGIADEDVADNVDALREPIDVDAELDRAYLQSLGERDEQPNDEQLNADLQAWAQESAARDRAQLQQTISQQRRTINNGDWRVRLRLSPKADYLYNAPDPGILKPLQVTDGIIFPYTPSIDTQYRANYSAYDLTHSNYRGYFYQNSYVDAVNVRAIFTAQSTSEANYLLAVIHFLKSATKMFYGQENTYAGSPPPIVYLTGLGEYQFNEHSCLIQAFNYSLPADVDYIRSGSPNINNTNLSQRRAKQASVPGAGLFGGLLGGALQRLANAGAPKGGITAPPPPPTLGLDRPTYVPTKMEISITLLPVQSRAQVSKQFSVKKFANGDLLKGGFW